VCLLSQALARLNVSVGLTEGRLREQCSTHQPFWPRQTPRKSQSPTRRAPSRCASRGHPEAPQSAQTDQEERGEGEMRATCEQGFDTAVVDLLSFQGRAHSPNYPIFAHRSPKFTVNFGIVRFLHALDTTGESPYEGCGEFVLLGRLASGAESDLLPYALPPGCSAGRNPGAVARTRTRHLCPPLGLAQDHRSTEATRPARVTGR